VGGEYPFSADRAGLLLDSEGELGYDPLEP